MSEKLDYQTCDAYMSQRTGKYEWRAVRYRKAANFMRRVGLDDSDTICDVGAGWTELDYLLRTELNWRGRYIPLDASMFPLDLNNWNFHRPVEHMVALEILEHLHEPEKMLLKMLKSCTKSLTISVPNPATVDVLAMDATHVSLPDRDLFEKYGMNVSEEMFYGGVFSNGEPDALFASREF